MGDRTGITIDEVKIRRVNTDALFTQGFLSKPDGGSDQPSADDIDGAITGIRMPEHPDQRFQVSSEETHPNSAQISNRREGACAPSGRL
jgi:hypothetical protein